MPRGKRIDADVRQLRMKPKLWYRGYQFFYSEPLNLIIQRLDSMVRNGLSCDVHASKRRHPGCRSRYRSRNPTPAGASQFIFTEGWWKSQVEPEVLKRGLKLDFNHHNLFLLAATEPLLQRLP